MKPDGAADRPRRRCLLAGAAAVALAALLLFTFNLGGYALWDPDEGRHAEVAREMLIGSGWKSFVLPRLNYHPYHDKPAGYYWPLCVAFRLGGMREAPARTVSAIAGALLVLAVYGWSVRRLGAASAVGAALVLATAPEFFALARFVSPDMTFTALVACAVLAFGAWATDERHRQERWPWLAYVCAGLATLVKGLLGPVLVAGPAVLFALALRSPGMLRHARPFRGALVVLVLAGPWYLLAGMTEPSYMREFIIHHHFERFFSARVAPHREPFYYYLPVLAAGFFPWTVLLPPALARAAAASPTRPERLLALLWGGFTLVFFSLSRGKVGTYILPAFPPLAILTGEFLAVLARGAELGPRERRWVIGANVAAAAIMLAAGPVTVAVLLLVEPAAAAAGTIAFALAPWGALLWRATRRGKLRCTPPLLAGASITLLLLFARFGAPAVSRVQGARALGKLARRTQATVISFRARENAFLFYARRPVLVLADPWAVRALLEREDLTLLVVRRRHAREAERLFAPRLHLWAAAPDRRLYGNLPAPAR